MNRVRLGVLVAVGATVLGCAAAGCSASSGGSSSPVWDGTLGGPSGSGSGSGGGGDVDATASDSSSGGSSGSSSGTSPTSDGGGTSDGARADGAAPVDAGPPEDTGSPANTFTLIDTSVTGIVNGQPVSGWDPIPENAVIDLAKVGTALSIRVNTTDPTVASVGFVLDTVTTHTENAVPYMMCSDDGAGTITPCPLTPGAHVLTVTPYDAANLGGTALPSTTLYFTLVDGPGDGGTD